MNLILATQQNELVKPLPNSEKILILDKRKWLFFFMIKVRQFYFTLKI